MIMETLKEAGSAPVLFLTEGILQRKKKPNDQKRSAIQNEVEVIEVFGFHPPIFS